MILSVLLLQLTGAGILPATAQELSCKTKKGVLSSLPKICDGMPYYLEDPSFCKSCAVSDQAFAKAPVVNELDLFLENPMVSVGKPGGDPDVKTVAATCLGERGEVIPYQVYVRRREGCGRYGDKLKPAEIKARAEMLAKKDREKFSTIPRDELLANWKERIERYKIEKQCMNGVRLSLQEVTKRSNGDVYPNNFGEMIDLNHKQPGIDERSLPALEKAFGKEGSPERKAFEEKYEKAFRKTGQVCHGVGTWGYSQSATVNDIEVAVPATGYFRNSQGELDPAQASRIKDDIQKKILEEKAKHPGCLGALKSVEVEASANKLANGGGYEKWDFHSLSEDRANFMLRSVLPAVNVPEMKSFDFSRVKPTLGERNTGASGPCPYKLVSAGSVGVFDIQRVVVDPDYKVPGSEKAQLLEEAKRVKAVLRFSNLCKTPFKKDLGVMLSMGDCLGPVLQCR